MSIIFFAINFVSTFALIHKNMTRKIPLNIAEIDITLNDVLSHKNAVYLFMVYLTTEFSIELLLSYIECTQFEQFLLDKINEFEASNEEELPSLSIDDIIKNSNIPQSDILECNPTLRGSNTSNSIAINKTLRDAKLRAHKLYNKYICVGSEFEINLSSIMRKTITNVLGNKKQLVHNKNINLSDLLLLYEKPKQEMRRYLNYSYTRFKYQKEFEQIIQLFADLKGDKHYNMNRVNTKILIDKNLEETIETNQSHSKDKPRLDLKNISSRLQLAITKSNTPSGYVNMTQEN
eukprot:274044_1